jgi:DNA-binding IscR family transcriptional regulator
MPFACLVALAQAPGKPIFQPHPGFRRQRPLSVASKIMQKLHEQSLVESIMGPFCVSA